jgi:hypothetical protein
MHRFTREPQGSEAACQRASAECGRVRAQLADMTEGRRTDGVKARRRLAVSVAREAIEREAIEAALTTKLDELGMKYVIETSGLSLESNTKTSKLVHLETVFKAQIRQLRREKDAEIEQLTEEKAKLAAKVQMLLASKSTKRSVLYWAGLQQHNLNHNLNLQQQQQHPQEQQEQAQAQEQLHQWERAQLDDESLDEPLQVRQAQAPFPYDIASALELADPMAWQLSPLERAEVSEKEAAERAARVEREAQRSFSLARARMEESLRKAKGNLSRWHLERA